jgi:hypothetical protein
MLALVTTAAMISCLVWAAFAGRDVFYGHLGRPPRVQPSSTPTPALIDGPQGPHAAAPAPAVRGRASSSPAATPARSAQHVISGTRLAALLIAIILVSAAVAHRLIRRRWAGVADVRPDTPVTPFGPSPAPSKQPPLAAQPDRQRAGDGLVSPPATSARELGGGGATPAGRVDGREQAVAREAGARTSVLVDRRASQRVRYEVPAHLRWPGGRLDVTTENLSVEGAKCGQRPCHDPIPRPGTRGDLTLSLHGTLSLLRVRVTWSRIEDSTEAAIGLRFTDLTDAQQLLLHTTVTEAADE